MKASTVCLVASIAFYLLAFAKGVMWAAGKAPLADFGDSLFKAIALFYFYIIFKDRDND